MLNKLAPIILFAYNRPWHTEKVLMALKNNQLAEQSHLIVFVDGFKVTATPEDRQNIEEVRRVVQKEKWCGSVEYYISETNLGCRNSIIAGISQVFVTYEAAIVLEDDIVTSPYFLKYMNLTLNYYKEKKSVFSVSGHNLPESKLHIPNEYEYDVYVSYRLLNWGWGTWADRWFQTNWNKTEIPVFLDKSEQVKAFNRGGDDLSRMLLEEFEGKSDAWDIQFAYAHFVNHAVSIVPCHSYIQNIGLDGTGTHVPKGTLMDNHLNLAVSEPRLLDVLYEDSRIINAFYNAFCEKKRPLWKKAINFIWRKLWMRPPFIIKQKVYCR